MIEYLIIRDKSSRDVTGIVDSAKSIIWHSTYYGVGDFEVYAIANDRNIALLQEGNWIARNGSDEIGIIEKVESDTTLQDGSMLIASGRFAKSILDRRHIYKLSGKVNKPTVLSGNVESAVRSLVTNNAINCSFDSSRNIPFLQLGASAGTTATIIDELGQAAQKQVSYENLLEYTEAVLKEYDLAARVALNDATNNLVYTVYQGADRSIDNTAGNDPIIFSKEYDNLVESKYSFDKSTKKTAALIGGAGEDVERFYSLIAGTETGFERREMFVDASSLNRDYKDDSEVEHTYTDAEYRSMLKAFGKQELAKNTITEAFEASINVNGGVWKLNEDYFLGDIVTLQDNQLGKYANVRISELTEIQDENGYNISPVFDF